jgi:prophage DNA circulation protein
MPEIFEQYPVAQWTPKGGTAKRFPVVRIEEIYSKRVVQHERMYRKGARLDCTGAKARGWNLTCEVYNGHKEPDVAEQIYPDLANELCDSFDSDDTGDLTLPTRGPVRCKAESYRRVEDAEERDTATITFTFIEDNEDDAQVSNWQAPKAQSAARPAAESATDALAEGGAWDESISSLNELASDLEAYASAPGDYMGDIESRANAVTKSCQQIEDTFTNSTNEVGNEVALLMLDPEASRGGRQIRKLNDMASRATIDKATSKQTVPRTYPYDTDIFRVAADVGQNPAELMAVNPHVPDHTHISAGTVVNVFVE